MPPPDESKLSSQPQIYGLGNPGLKVMGSESNKTLRDGRMWREGENYLILLHCNICINRLSTPSRCLRPGDLVYTVAWILNPPSKPCAYTRMQWESVKLSTWAPDVAVWLVHMLWTSQDLGFSSVNWGALAGYISGFLLPCFQHQ